MGEPHDYVRCSDEDRCQVCGAKYHCDRCRQGCGMLGHWSEDDRGSYYTCEEPERREAQLALYKAAYETQEKVQLARLQQKYPGA